MSNSPSRDLPKGKVVTGNLRVQLKEGLTVEDLMKAIDSVVVSPSVMELGEIRTASYGDQKREIWIFVGKIEYYDLQPYAQVKTYGSHEERLELSDEDVQKLKEHGVCTAMHLTYRHQGLLPPAETSLDAALLYVSDLGFKVSGAGVHLQQFGFSIDSEANYDEAWLQFRVPDDLTFKGIE